MSFLIKDDELFKKYNEIVKRLSKKFASESVYNEKYLKAKILYYFLKLFIIEKPKQISTIIKYQKKVLNVFFYLQFWSILFLEQVQIIVVNYFHMNVNILLRKKRCKQILLMT